MKIMLKSIVVNNFTHTIYSLVKFTNPSGSLSYKVKLLTTCNYLYRQLSDNTVQILIPDNVNDTGIVMINDEYYMLNDENEYINMGVLTRKQIKEYIRKNETKRALLNLGPITSVSLKDYQYNELFYDQGHFSILHIEAEYTMEYLNIETDYIIEYLNNDTWMPINMENVIKYKIDDNHYKFYIPVMQHTFVRIIIKQPAYDHIGERYKINYYTNDRWYNKDFCKFVSETLSTKIDIYKYSVVDHYNKIDTTIPHIIDLPIVKELQFGE